MKDITAEKKNLEFCQATIDADRQTEEAIMALAERYYRIYSLNLYTPSWDSFEEFCLEIKGRSYKTVMKLIAIHEKFVITYKISPARISEAGGWSVISELLPVIETKADAEQWLERAKVATREHLRQDVREARKGMPQGSCEHLKRHKVEICDDCGVYIHV